MTDQLPKIIRNEIVRQYRDDERKKCPAGIAYYEEKISPYLIALKVRAALADQPEVPRQQQRDDDRQQDQ